MNNSEFLNPTAQCDLIMQGGITSGVVYPGAVLKLATRYRFRSIGGTSAGAMAAAATAAAELGKLLGARRIRTLRPQAASEGDAYNRQEAVDREDPGHRRRLHGRRDQRRNGAYSARGDRRCRTARRSCWSLDR